MQSRTIERVKAEKNDRKRRSREDDRKRKSTAE
jgi:hypothetical protein